MEHLEIATDNIDELFSWGGGWDNRYLQLSPGRLGFRMRQIRLPGLLTEWDFYGQSE